MSATSVCNHNNVSLEAVADTFEDTNVRLLRMRLVCLGCGKPMRFVGVREGLSIDAPAVRDKTITMPFVVGEEEPDAGTLDLF